MFAFLCELSHSESFTIRYWSRGIRYVVFAMIYLVSYANAQDCPDTLWTRVYDMPPGVAALAALDQTPTADGGLILCGWYGYWPTSQVWIARVDSIGDTLWTRSFGDLSQNEYAYALTSTQDNNYLAVGFRGWGSGENPDDSSAVYVIKFSPAGDTLWTRTYGGRNSRIGRDVVQTTDGFAIVGTTNYMYAFYDDIGINADSSDIFLLTISEDGERIMERTYGGEFREEAYCVSETSHNGFAILGSCRTADYTTDVFFLVVDSTGSIIDSEVFGHLGVDDYAIAMDKTSTGFLLSGEARIPPGSEAYVVCVDSTGTMLWDSTFRHYFSSVGRGIEVLEGDSFVVAISSLRAVGLTDLYVIWGGPEGRLFRECTITLSYPMWELYPWSIVETDAMYSICGEIAGSTNGAFLMKTDTDPLGVGEQVGQLLPNEYSIHVYPNPFNGITQLQLFLSRPTSLTIDLYNVSGQLVRHVHDGQLPSGTSTLFIDLDDMPSGIYFLQTTISAFHDSQKLIHLR